MYQIGKFAVDPPSGQSTQIHACFSSNLWVEAENEAEKLLSKSYSARKTINSFYMNLNTENWIENRKYEMHSVIAVQLSGFIILK